MNMVVTHQGPATRRTPITPSEIFFFFFKDFARLYPQKSNSNLNCPSPGHPHILFLWSHGPAVLCLWVRLWLGGSQVPFYFTKVFVHTLGCLLPLCFLSPPHPLIIHGCLVFWIGASVPSRVSFASEVNAFSLLGTGIFLERTFLTARHPQQMQLLQQNQT